MTLGTPPRTSIVITTYNVRQYVGDAVRSALEQSDPPAEVIIVDDGSNDGTIDLVRGIDPARVSVEVLPRLGPGLARNRGLAVATGEFILFLDGDDMLAPDCLHAFNDAHASAGNLDLFCFSGIVRDELGSAKFGPDHYVRRPGTFELGAEALADMLRHQRFLASPCLYVFRKSVADDCAIRFEPGLHEDEGFTGLLFASSGLTVLSDHVGFFRRVRAGSITTGGSSVANVRGYLGAANTWESRIAERLPGGGTAAARRYARKLRRSAIGHAFRIGLSFFDFARLCGDAGLRPGAVASSLLPWLKLRIRGWFHAKRCADVRQGAR